MTDLLLGRDDDLAVLRQARGARAPGVVLVAPPAETGGRILTRQTKALTEASGVAADKLGPLKVLVNNAGVMDQQNRLDEMTTERIRRILDINTFGSILCAREAVKRMSTKHGGTGGSIVNMSSAAAYHGAPGLGVEYGASKGAIDVLTIGLGREVAAEGVRVNALRPGIIDTEIHDSSGIPGRVKMMRDAIPMKREGTADEVADAIMWLCSDQSSYVTGTIIPVAGGRC